MYAADTQVNYVNDLWSVMQWCHTVIIKGLLVPMISLQITNLQYWGGKTIMENTLYGSTDILIQAVTKNLHGNHREG